MQRSTKQKLYAYLPTISQNTQDDLDIPHMDTRVVRPAKFCIHQLCEHTKGCQEDLVIARDDRDRKRKRERERERERGVELRESTLTIGLDDDDDDDDLG